MDITLILAANIGGIAISCRRKQPCSLNEENQFLENLRKYFPQDANILLIASDPERIYGDDYSFLKESFTISKLPFNKFDINKSKDIDDISKYNFLILGPGNVSDQNKFYNEINLKDKIKNFKGVILATHGGTENCSDIVYEDDDMGRTGEFIKLKNGLGISKYNVLEYGHYDENEFNIKSKNIKDVKQFYSLSQKSYIIQRGKEITLFGEIYLAENQKLTKICENDKSISIN